MKTIKEILDNYENYEVDIDDRFGSRFFEFLTIEEMSQIGIELKEEYQKDWKPKDWTRENVLEQLKEDVCFAMEKMSDQRGISSGLMYEVVHSWMKVLEDDELIKELNRDYYDYGKSHMRMVAEKYNIDIKDVDY
jgi:hypothetical protein